MPQSVNGMNGGVSGVTDGSLSQPHHQQYHHQNSSALSTAAMVAAATATATATASVVALQENSQFNQLQGSMQNMQTQNQYTPSYSQQRSSHVGSPMGTMGGNSTQQQQMQSMAMNGMSNSMNGINGINGMSAMSNMSNMGMNPSMHNGTHSMMNGNPNAMANMNKMAAMQQMPTQQNYHPRRLAPYPSPAMHMSQKRGTPQTYPTSNPQSNFQPTSPQYPQQVQQVGYGPQTTGGRPPSFQNQYQPQPQQSLGPNSFPAQNSRTAASIRQSTPPYNSSGQYFNNQGGMQGGPVQFNPNHHSNVPTGPVSGSGQYGSSSVASNQYIGSSNQFQQDMNSMRNNVNYQHSPIPGNPTPPLTPASSMPPYISPNSDIKPNFNELKPPMSVQSK